MEAAQATATRQDQANRQNNGEGPSRAEPSRWEFWTRVIAATEVLFSFCLLSLAVVGGYIGYGQLNTMREQNDVMMEQNKLMLEQQRPWISLKVKVVDEPMGGEPWFVGFEMENQGQLSGDLHEVQFDVAYFTPGKEIPGIGKLEFRSDDTSFGNFPIQDGTEVTYGTFNRGSGRPYGRPYRVNLDREYNGTRENLYDLGRTRGTYTLLRAGDKWSYQAAKIEKLDESLVVKIKSREVVPFISAMLVYDGPNGSVHRSYVEGIYIHSTKAIESANLDSLLD